MIFFGKEGLTNAEATHICNLAKESWLSDESIIEHCKFYSVNVSLISNSITELSKGNSIDTLNKIPDILEKIAKKKSLVAWLREAISAKESKLTKVKCLDNITICKELGLEFPSAPVKEHILTEEEYYGSLPINERNRYYYLETLTAVIGKAIHKNGAFNQALKDVRTVISNPSEVQGEGRDAMIFHKIPTVDLDKLEQTMFELQNKHREYQSQLNGIKHLCSQAIEKSINTSDAKYSEDRSKYNNDCELILAKITEWRTKKLQEIGNLKIVIPNDLKDIYSEIINLGR